MRSLRTGIAELPDALRICFVLALACWTVAASLLVTAPARFTGGVPVAFVAYWIVAVFAAAALTTAIVRTTGATRAFWTILGAGVLLRFVGNAGPASLWIPYLDDAAYSASYILLFIGLLWLVAKTARNVTLLAALDTLGVMFFTGLISWHLALGPASWAGWASLNPLLFARSGPVFDVGLLCLALVVASSNRRLARCAFALAGAFGAFLVADGLYLGLQTYTLYETGGWPELFWALGIAFIGLAAMSANGSSGSMPQLVFGSNGYTRGHADVLFAVRVYRADYVGDVRDLSDPGPGGPPDSRWPLRLFPGVRRAGALPAQAFREPGGFSAPEGGAGPAPEGVSGLRRSRVMSSASSSP